MLALDFNRPRFDAGRLDSNVDGGMDLLLVRLRDHMIIFVKPLGFTQPVKKRPAINYK